MKNTLRLIPAAVIFLVVIFTGCSGSSGDDGVKKLESLESEGGERSPDVGEKGEGEEDGTQFGKSDDYDVVKKELFSVVRK